MRIKKHLGQHFLKSQKALSQIVDAGNINPGDLVLEIGPGEGVLTSLLLEQAQKVIAVEKDSELIPLLEKKFSEEIKENKLELIEADILKFDIEKLKAKKYKLIANIPYYITGAIIEKFLSASHQPEQMVLLIQKEVAERIVARDPANRRAGKKESVLSIAVKAYGNPKIIAKVPAGAFVPPPKVDSAIISIEGISRNFFQDLPTQTGCDEGLFFKVLKFIFGKKRKQIGGSLSDFIDNRTAALTILSDLQIDSKTRPEDLTLFDWKRLTKVLKTMFPA